MAETDPKCSACSRTTETHAPGCSLMECPHRRVQVWEGLSEGAQGMPGQLAEERGTRAAQE